jgi:hypothetical protein
MEVNSMKFWLGVNLDDARINRNIVNNIEGIAYSESRDMYVATEKGFQKLLNIIPDMEDIGIYNDNNKELFIIHQFDFNNFECESINSIGKSYEITDFAEETIQDFIYNYVDEEKGIIKCEDDFAEYIDGFIKTSVMCEIEHDLEKFMFDMNKYGFDIAILKDAFCIDYDRMLEKAGKYVG